MISLKAFLVSFLAITSHLCQCEGAATLTPTSDKDGDATINFHKSLSSLAPAGIPEAENEDNELVIKSKEASNNVNVNANPVINQDVKPYAEHYRGFLLFFLREVWGARGPYTVLKEADKVDGNGLYFFFWSLAADPNDINKQSKIYPLYVGMTGRSFKQRFNEHIKNGVVQEITSGQWPSLDEQDIDHNIVAYVYNMPLPVAKFFESVFLNAFDFAMNAVENNGERLGFDFSKTRTVLEGWFHFQKAYEKIKSYSTEIDKLVSDEAIRKAGDKINYYQKP